MKFGEEQQQVAGTERIFGSGEMPHLIRSRDWATSPLGPQASWPDTLVVSLNNMLSSQFPMVLLWGPDRIHFYNDGFRKSLGSDKHPRCLGEPVSLCYPEVWERTRPKVDAVLQTGEASWVENEHQPFPADGALRDAWWTYSYSPVRSPEGAIEGVLIVCQETTHSVETERKLMSALEATSDSVLGVDRNWRINFLNQRAVASLSPLASTSNLIGADIWTTFPSMIYAGSPYVEHYRRAMDQGVPADFEAHYPDPLNFWVHVSVRPATDGIIFFFRDITQKKREHAALIQSEKLAAIGRLASSIAHEINNPLESLTNLLYLLQIIDDPQQREAFFKQAQGELDRIARITTQTLRFHRQSKHPQPVRLTDVVENVLALMAGRLRRGSITLTKQYRTERPVMGYEADLRQVLANFLSNALDAVGAEGRIVVRVEESAGAAGQAPSVRVVIADTGHGMDRSTSGRIFEPFFTTRPLTGTGLGLWVSTEILDQHGAKVRVRSTQEAAHHGTVFSLIFPSTPPASLISAAQS